jgi:hypothetical protein
MAGQGSTGNVIAALASFFLPGLGQLLQGRLGMALLQFCLATALWFFLMGWIIHPPLVDPRCRAMEAEGGLDLRSHGSRYAAGACIMNG